MMFEILAESMPLSMVTEHDLRTLCFKPGIKINTQRSYLRHYNAFFKWAYKKRYMAKDITEFVIPPKEVENTQEKIISEKEFNLILKNYHEHIAEVKEKYPYVSDDQMMDWFEPVVKIGFYAGLRVKEIVNLRWMDIDLKKNLICVRNTNSTVTKTGRFRFIPIRKELLKTLKKWHKDKFDFEDHYVFKSPTTNPLMNIKIDPGNVSKKFKRFVRRSKLPETITFHGLRHSCITDLLTQNVPLQYVTRIAGHTSYQTTKRYEHLTPEDLQNAFKNID